jgi:hypothetical protein
MGGFHFDESKAKQSKAKQSKAKQSKAKQSKAMTRTIATAHFVQDTISLLISFSQVV